MLVSKIISRPNGVPTSIRPNNLIILLLQIAAFWSVWQWYIGRLLSSGEESWSLLALLTAAGLCFHQIHREPVKENSSSFSVILPTIFVLLYAVSFALLPPLAKAILAVTAVCLTLSQIFFRQFLHLGLYALLLLGLPLVASLNFFLGFPLRVIVGEATAFLLRLNGLAVRREGVCLHFGEQLISIDAPCSGIKMLWFGFFLAAVLVTFYKLNFWRSLAAFAAALTMIMLGNIARAAALFYTESGIIKTPAWTHEAVGVFAFILTAVSIVAALQFLRSEIKWRVS